MNVLIEKTEVVEEDLHQETRSDYKELKANIKQQRDENELLHKSLKQIQKDTESQKKKIDYFRAKIEELEQHVGIINVEQYASSIENQDSSLQKGLNMKIAEESKDWNTLQTQTHESAYVRDGKGL